MTLKTGKQKLYKIEAQKKKNFLKIPADFIKIYINFYNICEMEGPRIAKQCWGKKKKPMLETI